MNHDTFKFESVLKEFNDLKKLEHNAIVKNKNKIYHVHFKFANDAN